MAGEYLHGCGWAQERHEELADLCLSQNGKIFTAGYAETWGGGAEYKTDDGGFIARYDRFESGIGDPVKCIATAAEFVFWGTPGKRILWAAHGGGDKGWWGDRILSFSSTGTPGPEITDFEKPLALAVNKSGQLQVGGLNEHSHVWIYSSTGAPSKVGAFGTLGGIFSGTAGAFTNSPKLHWIKAIAVDASANIYMG